MRQVYRVKWLCSFSNRPIPANNPLTPKQAGEIIIARNPTPRIFEKIEFEKIEQEENISSIVGIDFGTNASAVAVIKGRKPFIIRNQRGEKFTPSVVAFSQKGEVVIGTPAVAQAASNPDRTIFSIKTKLGTDWHIDIDSKVYTSIDIAALIFQNLKEDAESYLDRPVIQAVITVPAYFNTRQRQALTDAASKTGLEIFRLVAEPTAASLAYNVRDRQIVAVCDLGGGTFDVSIIGHSLVGEGERHGPVYEVDAVNGDPQLGGDNIDERIVEYLMENFKEHHNIDLFSDKAAKIRLKQAAEQAKIALSELETVNIYVPYIYADQNGIKHISVDLTRSKFEELISDLINKIRDYCRYAIRDSSSVDDVTQIDELILVGLSTKVPLIRQTLTEFFRKRSKPRIDPEEAIVLGAAVQAGVLSGNIKDTLLIDAIPLTLGVETLGGVSTPIIERNTTFPNKKIQFFTTTADEQTKAKIHVTQGERPMASDNESLGGFVFDKIPPSPKGVARLRIEFNMHTDVLLVSVKDIATGKEESRRVSSTINKSNRYYSDIDFLEPIQFLDTDDVLAIRPVRKGEDDDKSSKSLSKE